MAEVTLLIPTWNRAELLMDAVKTALSQTVQDVKVIVYDDGSDDGTEKVIAKTEDDRLQYVRSKEHHGVAYARNRLLEIAQTKYGCWLDSDDISNIYRVELLLQVMKRYNPPFVRSSYTTFAGKMGSAWKAKPPLVYPKRHAVATGLFRMDCAPGFDDRIDSHGEDVVWEMEMVANHGTGMCLGVALYDIRRGKNHRVSKLQNSMKMKGKWRRQPEIRERYMRSEAARVPLNQKWSDAITALGLKPKVRVEYVPSEMIEFPFEVDEYPEFRLPCQDANSWSSKRIMDWPKVTMPVEG